MLKKLLVLLILPTSLLIAGCQTPQEALTSAENLRTEVLSKITEIKTGVENATTAAKDAYEGLVEKKKQLEALIDQVNAAKESMDKLLGKDETEVKTADLEAEKAELQKTIDELQAELKKTETSIEEADVNKAVESLQ